ncbi:T9SS C-terminal target domain-containing protein [Polaribacter sp. WD7]|uniref:T9SS type A sorting domain-containing protein n=1 Tax=Polaribacter sp. WD7 TaxID=2269061 RepID=UPI000DF30B7B|nr:T9SS type A sorting domain-containing protein [Polaribacter sp. WD7]RCS27941.1 T9SS C-terminal target domain-containing protein [Polaribacter sp. WD7]
MKKLHIILMLLLLNINFCVAQNFNWQSVKSITNIDNQRFDDVFFLDKNTGWAANGFHAEVYKTIDGGVNWTKQLDGADLGTGLYFRNIEFLNTDIGFLGTFQGRFFKTTNGGETWGEVTGIIPNPSGICGIETVGTSTVYGVGVFSEPARLIKSTDSGNTWVSIDMSVHATALVEVQFVDENTGYASGRNETGGIIIKTTDAGATWTEIYNTGIGGEYIWKLQILEASENNIIFGAVQQASANPGRLLKSIDAGSTWVEKNVPGADIQAVGFISETHGWMGGSELGIMETLDGGDTWAKIDVGGNLNRIFVINNIYAFASGTTIYKYTNETLSTQNIANARNPLSITLSENPVAKELLFTVQYRGSDNMVIELYDINGKLLRQLAKDKISDASGIQKEYSFEVSDLSAGVYLVNFHNNTGRQTLKFIKK